MRGYGHVEFATAEAAQKVNNLLTKLVLNAAQSTFRSEDLTAVKFYLTPTGSDTRCIHGRIC